VTNISYGVRQRDGLAAGISLVAVEATRPVACLLESGSLRRPALLLTGVRTRMPDATIAVYDGLLDTIGVTGGPDGLRLIISLAHPTIMTIRTEPGIPARLSLELSREPLWHIMKGHRVLVDPGHGGNDMGGRGPIDLLEKRMTLAVANYLIEQLSGLGCQAWLTRAADVHLYWRERLAVARRERSGVIVSLHTAWSSDPTVAGIGVQWLNQNGQALAERIHAALLRRLPLPDRGLGAGSPAVDPALPAVVVEFATISNPVEEGWLRSSTFLKRAALAMADGIKNYFAGNLDPPLANRG